MLQASVPATPCGLAFFDDSVFQSYSEQLEAFPTVAALVVLDISAARSVASKEAIYHRLGDVILPGINWHSSALHYTASTVILDFDSNGKIRSGIACMLYTCVWRRRACR